MGACMNDLGILPRNTLDSSSRLQFLIFRQEDHEKAPYRGDNDWYWKHQFNRKQLKECCATYVFVVHNYKGLNYQEMITDFMMLEEKHHFGPIRRGGIRVVEEPDFGPFKFSTNDMNFTINENLDSCDVVKCDNSPTAKG